MKIRRKSYIVEARQVPVYEEYTDTMKYLSDCVELADWVDGTSHMMYSPDDEETNHIKVFTPRGYVRALPGDWITKDDKAGIGVMSDEFFWSDHEIEDDSFWREMDSWLGRILPWVFATALLTAMLGLLIGAVITYG